MPNQQQEPRIAIGTSYIDRIFLEMGLIRSADSTFLEDVREMHTYLPDGHETQFLYANSSNENSDSASDIPELIDSSEDDSSEDEFETRANDSSEDEFETRAHDSSATFLLGPATFADDFAFSQYNQMARLQCIEFQARGACHVHG